MDKYSKHRDGSGGRPQINRAGIKYLTVIAGALLVAGLVLGCSLLNPAKNSDKTSNKPTLKIGIDIYEPYSYYDDLGQVTGIDVELAREACDRLGYTPEFVGISWEKKDELLESGEIDCIWSCYSMTGREEKYLWAGPYMNSYQAAVVRADSGITSLSQLENKRIGVETTTKSEEAWTKHAGEVVPTPSDVLTYTGADETYSALRLGYVDAVSGHVGPMSALVKNSNGYLALIEGGFYDTQIGVAFYKNYSNQQLVEDLNATLKAMCQDGSIASIAEKYGLSAALFEGLDNE